MRILLVEDDQLTAEMILNILQDADFEVSHASNGQEALDLYNKDAFPLVITDIIMPVMDGIQLISKLQKQNPRPVIIVQSAINKIQQVIGLHP